MRAEARTPEESNSIGGVQVEALSVCSATRTPEESNSIGGVQVEALSVCSATRTPEESNSIGGVQAAAATSGRSGRCQCVGQPAL